MTDLKLPEYPINVAKLPKLGNTFKLSIDDKGIGAREILSIVEHLGVMSIEKLTLKMNFRHWSRDGIQVDGEILSLLHSQCPVTLQGVEQQIESSFYARFVHSESKLAKPQLNEDGEMILDVDGEDMPDIYEGDYLDAWEIGLEYLVLEIDYFARLKGAVFEYEQPGGMADEENISPFAKLQSLKK
ncbi:MAG: DUF177 domain-containing protein [Hyphomicrobiales bacterium]|nr:DUF177 domain-containing protein [Hyphomicrobiales bacterium]